MVPYGLFCYCVVYCSASFDSLAELAETSHVFSPDDFPTALADVVDAAYLRCFEFCFFTPRIR